MYVSLFPCQRRVGYGLTLLQGLRVACYVQLVAICAVYLSWSSTSAEASRGSGAHIHFLGTVVSTLRIYAIMGRRVLLPSLVLVFSLVPVATNIVRSLFLVLIRLRMMD